MKTLETRVPKHNETVTVEGRTGSLAVIGIDAMNKTVELRTIAVPIVVVQGVPWTTHSYVG